MMCKTEPLSLASIITLSLDKFTDHRLRQKICYVLGGKISLVVGLATLFAAAFVPRFALTASEGPIAGRLERMIELVDKKN
ncbi:MAG: hypothetical protein AB8G05_19490 [Oligoflexales bacterium]